jgi:subtilisin family serine protease
MKHTTHAIALLLATAALGAGDPPAVEDPIVPDEVMVRVARPAALDAFVAALDPAFPTARVLDSIKDRDTHLVSYALPPGGSAIDVEALLDALALDGTILWGELNYEGQTGEGRTDSLWVSQVDIGHESYAGQYAFDLLGIGAAHRRSTGLGVVVAVLDVGVDAKHPMLAGSIVPGGASFIGGRSPYADVGNGIDDDGDGLLDEMVGHGTFVAGLVRLVAPDAGILPITVLNDDGIGTSWSIAKGMYHAIDAGADVVNMSLGSTCHAKAVEEASAEALAKGIVVVCAAGNLDVEDPREFPACDSSAFGVAATDRFDLKAPFSNFNHKLDLAAPGHSEPVGEAFDPAASVISTVPGGGFGVWKGTSFSTAFVSGAAALIRAQHPEWRSAQTPTAQIAPPIIGRLASSAVPLDAWNPGYARMLGAGRIDCGAAVLLGPPQPLPGDLDGDGAVGSADLAVLLGAWGGCLRCAADLDGDGAVGAADLAIILGLWS